MFTGKDVAVLLTFAPRQQPLPDRPRRCRRSGHSLPDPFYFFHQRPFRGVSAAGCGVVTPTHPAATIRDERNEVEQ
jgi:hypothetical protein